HAQGASMPAGPPALALLSPRRMTEFPTNPYLALLEPSLIGQGYSVVDTASGQVVPLEEVEFSVSLEGATGLQLQAAVDGNVVWTATQTVDGEILTQSACEIRTTSG